MYFDSLSREELQEVIFQLEQASYNHQQWHNSLIRTLVCRLPSDCHDVSNEAHKECRFGQWYYGIASKELRRHIGFVALGQEHTKMHQEAAKILAKIDNGLTITPLEYDNFSNTLQRVQLEINALLRELNELLYTRDALTGAINRVNMLPVLREQQAMVKRNLQTCCVVMLDLDHFKAVNDQYGHLSGDFVLTWLSHFVQEHLRVYDKLFRVGGEEFLICLQDVNLQQAFEIIDRLRVDIAASQIKVHENKLINITVSFGITAIAADIAIEQVIANADSALYKAKLSGRNCTKIWPEDV